MARRSHPTACTVTPDPGSRIDTGISTDTDCSTDPTHDTKDCR